MPNYNTKKTFDFQQGELCSSHSQFGNMMTFNSCFSNFDNSDLQEQIFFIQSQYDWKEDVSSTQQPQSPQVVQLYPIQVRQSVRTIHPRYLKNICGYTLQSSLRLFASSKFESEALEFCHRDVNLYKKLLQFATQNKNKFNGYASIFKIFQVQNIDQLPQKQAFVNYLQWFVKERYARHVFSSNKIQNKQEYLKFKNTLFPKQFQKLRSHFQAIKNSTTQ